MGHAKEIAALEAQIEKLKAAERKETEQRRKLETAHRALLKAASRPPLR